MISNHLSVRQGMWQYVRRVPEDIRHQFPFDRVQKSLKTRDQKVARFLAVDLDREWDRAFDDAREKLGGAKIESLQHTISTADWTWIEWEALARWLELALAEYDWQARLTIAPGRLLQRDAHPRDIPNRADADVRELIRASRQIETSTAAEYRAQRTPSLQKQFSRLGIVLNPANQYFTRFMTACMSSELNFFELFKLRESKSGGIGNPHPDTVDGPWSMRRPAQSSGETPRVVGVTAKVKEATPKRTLADCIKKWIERRETAKQNVADEYVAAMRNSAVQFAEMTKSSYVEDVTRQKILAFQDHLMSVSEPAAATVNKKISFITTLVRIAASAGWVSGSIGGDISLPIPEDQGGREPYSDESLRNIFAHRIFTNGFRFDQKKACNELQYWLPLISFLHGMSSSEIIQLGPESIVPHPTFPEILCFVVTNAGGRSIKTLARKRYVPVRRELVELGLLNVVENARQTSAQYLWYDMNEVSATVKEVSKDFSSFWSRLSEKELAITEDSVSLYSFRHNFQDSIEVHGYDETVVKALMGHSPSGMTKKYGTKKHKPKPVPIQRLYEAIHASDWPFLRDIQPYSIARNLDGCVDRSNGAP